VEQGAAGHQRAGGLNLISLQEVREALTGPIAALHTTFNRDGSIDFGGLRNLIDSSISGGARTMLLTHGDSLYTVLSDEEIAEVTRVVAKHTGDRAMVVAADGGWWTGQTVAFADRARDVGADVLMTKPPDWAGSCTVDTFVEHYAAVAERIPVMVVTNVWAGRTDLGLRTIEALRDRVDGIVAIKDDLLGQFARKMTTLVHDKWAVFAGGEKQNHLDIVHYGAVGYMSTFVKFAPAVATEYWQATQRGDWTGAAQVIRDHDRPYFDYVRKLRGGHDAAIHGVLELYDIAGRWRRKPYYSLSDQEMEAMRDFFKSRGWL
jgi:dihydrodipicolinate synthase/N-acetylneuraminate lyase